MEILVWGCYIASDRNDPLTPTLSPFGRGDKEVFTRIARINANYFKPRMDTGGHGCFDREPREISEWYF
jgi:hypothetical protein